jgi:hypothetical protein
MMRDRLPCFAPWHRKAAENKGGWLIDHRIALNNQIRRKKRLNDQFKSLKARDSVVIHGSTTTSSRTASD